MTLDIYCVFETCIFRNKIKHTLIYVIHMHMFMIFTFGIWNFYLRVFANCCFSFLLWIKGQCWSGNKTAISYVFKKQSNLLSLGVGDGVLNCCPVSATSGNSYKHYSLLLGTTIFWLFPKHIWNKMYIVSDVHIAYTAK